MARLPINIGTAINAGDGEAIRSAFAKVNSMMEELYDLLTANGLPGSFLEGGSVAYDRLGNVAPGRLLGNLSGLPAAPDGVTLAALASALPVSSVAPISSAYTVVAGDNARLLALTGTFTLALTAAATLGSGFAVRVKNVGTGLITIDPAGSETIDGATTLLLPARCEATLICTGTGWETFGLPAEVLLARGAAAGATLDLPLREGYSAYRLLLRSFEPVNANTNVIARFALDGVPTFITTNSYVSAGVGILQTAAANNFGNGTGNANLMALGSVQLATGGSPGTFELLIEPGGPSRSASLICKQFARENALGYGAVSVSGSYLVTGGRATHIRIAYAVGNIGGASSHEFYGIR